MRLWKTLSADFAGLPVLNRGFGGSTLAECGACFERLVVPHQPRALVLYAGDNDLDQGATPEIVLARFEQLARNARERLSWRPMLFISIKPSPARFWNAAQIVRANALIAEAIANRWREAGFLDLHTPMLGRDGVPQAELFGEDGLHMSRAGYLLWAAAVRTALADLGFR